MAVTPLIGREDELDQVEAVLGGVADGLSELLAAFAGSSDDVEERARHLALAADGPDDDVAAELDGAAAQAAARGATAAAATPAGEELTETERRVAALVARGRTNREIAAEPYMGLSTVEARLSHAYRKLGVRSAELARSLEGSAR